jgi:hypothetical protein
MHARKSSFILPVVAGSNEANKVASSNEANKSACHYYPIASILCQTGSHTQRNETQIAPTKRSWLHRAQAATVAVEWRTEFSEDIEQDYLISGKCAPSCAHRTGARTATVQPSPGASRSESESKCVRSSGDIRQCHSSAGNVVQITSI